MSGTQTPQNQGDDTLMSIAFLGILVAGMSFFAWYKFHTQITAGVFAVLDEELLFASLWGDQYRTMGAALAANDPSTIKIGQLLNAIGVVSHIYRFPAAAVLIALGGLCVVRASGEKYTERLDLDRLMKLQAQIFPSISAFIDRRLALVAPDLANGPRPADLALHLGEWISIYALSAKGAYDSGKARRGLFLQLGRPWRGVEGAGPAARAMFAVFALHAAREREKAAALLGELSRSLVGGEQSGAATPAGTVKAVEGPEGPATPLMFGEAAMSEVGRVLADASVVGPAMAVAARHGFTTTALMGLLMHARRRAGVLAPGQFAFLKLVDRSLWYALHSLGFPLNADEDGPMPNVRVEALGARAHWEAECCVDGPLTTPKLEIAEAAIRARIAHALNSKRSTLEVK
jgi:intracellular multiplication protein IcmP